MQCSAVLGAECWSPFWQTRRSAVAVVNHSWLLEVHLLSLYITSIVTIIENLWAHQARTRKVRDRIYYLVNLISKIEFADSISWGCSPSSAEVALWGVFTGETKDFPLCSHQYCIRICLPLALCRQLSNCVPSKFLTTQSNQQPLMKQSSHYFSFKVLLTEVSFHPLSLRATPEWNCSTTTVYFWVGLTDCSESELNFFQIPLRLIPQHPTWHLVCGNHSTSNMNINLIGLIITNNFGCLLLG